jgi:glycosyltransferase involved in cell wall biosynthesis
MATRVLHVTTRLTRGGAERRIHDVIRAVAAEHVVVIGRDSHPAAVEDLQTIPEVEPFELVRMPDLVRPVQPASDARAYRQLLALMREGSFDVVHTHQSKAGLLGRVAARQAGIPVVYHSASMASFGPGYSRGASLLFASAERLTAPLVTRYFVVGRDLCDRMTANGVSSRRIDLVRSSLDLTPFTPARPGEPAGLRAQLGVDPDRPVVGYVGVLDDRKGVTALPGLVRAATAGPVTLVIAGDGPRRAELQAHADDAGSRVSVRLLGHVRNVADVMRASDVLVLPSSAEGLPQVLVQASRCGLPFVSYDVDGARELLDLGARGRVVPLGDQGAFASALAAELAATADRVPADGLPAEEAADGDRWAAWDPDFVADQYLRRYQQDLGTALARDVGSASAAGLRGSAGGAAAPTVPVELPTQPGA